ncbi:putative BPI/LBP family protein At1g04970 [Rutidosis leptorrhynchoides]|uniref:putative BPI/LBP family protein At1g04970 n=1 Tax=Rutidosis leptorrhynchoides TaxID=125765 RepID=UPI003A98D346
MSPITIYLILIFSLFIPPIPTTADQSYISILINQNGLNFVKNLLITKAISSLTPTPISQIEKAVKIPVIGKVRIVLSDIIIYRVNVGSSDVRPGISGVSIVGSGVTSDMTVNWHYSYGSWVGPISISDSGTAAIEVTGMEIGLVLGLDYQEGSMKLSVMECNCHIRDISIDLKEGASWLYQGIVDAFKDEIISAVEKAFTKKLKSEISELASVLQTLPKHIPVDNAVSLNVTFVNNPFLSNTSLGFEINGLFVDSKVNKLSYHNHLQPPISCSDPLKMIGIALDEAVFESASNLYYDAKFMQWIVDKVPEQNLLNTAGWRFIIPQLYKKYPNADMNLNISLSDPPLVQIASQNIAATVYADLIIDVLGADETIPVICISLVMSGTGSVHIIGNNLAGRLNLDDFTMSLKWSKVGNLHMFLIQPVIWTMIETVFLPYANARLGIGFPLPIINGFTLQNAEIISSQSRITVCSDVSYEESFKSSHARIYTS